MFYYSKFIVYKNLQIVYFFSGVLFLIVASEGIKIEDSSSNSDESYKVTNNFSIKESKDVLSEKNNPFVSNVEISSSIKTDDVDNVEVNFGKVTNFRQTFIINFTFCRNIYLNSPTGNCIFCEYFIYFHFIFTFIFIILC